MSAIKNFFEKRKLAVKFKLAGTGHKLTDDTRAAAAASSGGAEAKPKRQPTEVTEEQKRAAEAALARSTSCNKTSGSGSHQMSSLKSQMKQEMLAEKKQVQKAAEEMARYSSGPTVVELEAAAVVPGVFFHCPLIGPEVLPKDEMQTRIEEFLLCQLAEEPVMASCLMIHTLNRNSDQIKLCIETICKYLDNIATNPGEEKYRKIRCSNKLLQERVFSQKGAQEFLGAAGFELKSTTGPDGESEDYMVLGEAKANDVDHLNSLKEILVAGEPIRPELSRWTKTFRSSSSNPQQGANSVKSVVLPSEFYAVSAEEIKREQQARTDAVELMGMLRTKEMRERDRQRELRRYRYCLMRIRFPDNTFVQGTFRAAEKLSAVREWLTDCLAYDWLPYSLSVSGAQRLGDKEDESSLAELELAPAALLSFAYDAKVVADVMAAEKGAASMQERFDPNVFLKPELLADAEYL